MFDSFPKSKFEIIDPDGQSRGATNAIHTGDTIIVLDAQLVIMPGDEMRRSLPNGTDETFEVLDPSFHEETFGIQPHFQVKVRKKGTFPHHTGGHFNITVSGANSRVNVGSSDRSINIAADSPVFGDLAVAINNGIADETERLKLLAAVEEMKKAQGSGGFVGAYQRFVGLAADHLGVLGPLLPALSGLLGG